MAQCISTHLNDDGKARKLEQGFYINIQVVPGRAGGRSFRRQKNYKSNKEFAYRMCTG